MEDKKGNVTRLLLAWRQGDESALGQLMPLVMDELRRIANGYMNKERPGHTLQPTALVNELYMKLVDVRRVTWQNRAHFYGTAATMMRRMLVDHARKHDAGKRGDGVAPSPIDDLFDRAEVKPQEILLLHDALEDLLRIDERKGRAVEMSYFVGLTYKEIGEVLGISDEAVKRDVRLARAWLLEYMQVQDERTRTETFREDPKGKAPAREDPRR